MNFSQFHNLPTEPNTTSDSCLNLLKSLSLNFLYTDYFKKTWYSY